MFENQHSLDTALLVKAASLYTPPPTLFEMLTNTLEPLLTYEGSLNNVGLNP